MEWWVALVLGLTLGWALEMAIDYIFWRNRYPEPDHEARLRAQISAIEAENNALRSGMTAFNQRLGAIEEAELSHAAQEARLDALLAEVNRLQQMYDESLKLLERRNHEAAQLRAALQGSEAQLAQLRSERDRRSD